MTQRYQRRLIGGEVVEIVDRIRAMDLAVTVNAEEGSCAISKVTVDDPDGDYDVTGHRLFAVYEDEALDPDDQYLGVGYVQRRRYKRGRSMITGAARIIEVDVADLNTVLGRRVMTGSDCNRPAETDVERMQWAVLTNEAGLIDDDTYLSTLNPVDMDACDYRGQYLMAVLEDCAEASGKNYFVTWLGPAFTEDDIESPWGTFSIFYDFSGSAVWDSGLFLTSVEGEVDGLNVFPAVAELERIPDVVYSGIYGTGDGFARYDQNATTAANFARRDMIASYPNVKSTGKMDARIDRQLEDLDEEDDRLYLSFLVDPVNVNRLRAGQRVQVMFPHLGSPGDYADWRWVRMLTRTVSQTASETGERLYKVSGEFATQPVVPGDGPDAPPPDPPPGPVDPPMDTLTATIEEGVHGGNNAYSKDVIPPDLFLYDGCTYHMEWAITHAHGGSATTSNYISVAIWREPIDGTESGVTSQGPSFNAGAARKGTAVSTWSSNFTTSVPAFGTAGVTGSHYGGHIMHTGYAGTNGWGSGFTLIVTYVSGPDPRFP